MKSSIYAAFLLMVLLFAVGNAVADGMTENVMATPTVTAPAHAYEPPLPASTMGWFDVMGQYHHIGLYPWEVNDPASWVDQLGVHHHIGLYPWEIEAGVGINQLGQRIYPGRY